MRIYNAENKDQMQIYSNMEEPQYIENIPLSLQQTSKCYYRNLCVKYYNGNLFVATDRGIRFAEADKKIKLLIKLINKNSIKQVHIR